MTSNELYIEDWLDQMEPHFLTIQDVKNMQHNEENEYLCICRNFYDFIPDIKKEEALKPSELFKNNYKMSYIHDVDLKGKTKIEEDDEFIKFEFHIEYKKGYWYPLKDGNLPHEDPQGIFDLSSIVRKKWTEYDDNTKVGWRGPMLKWKFVEEYDKKVYNCK